MGNNRKRKNKLDRYSCLIDQLFFSSVSLSLDDDELNHYKSGCNK